MQAKKKRLSPRQWRAIRRKQQFPEEQKRLKCSSCTGTMRLRESNLYGHFFYGCSRYPDCTHAHAATPKGRPLPGADGRPQPTKPRPEVPEIVPCKCGANLILKWSHRRQSWFYGCTQYPKCWLCKDAIKPTTLWEAVKEDLKPEQPEHRKKRDKSKLKFWVAVRDDFF